MEGFFVAVDDLATEVGVEVGWVAEHLEEAADALFGFVLGFLLHVDALVRLVEVLKDAVNQLQQLQWRFVVELHHGQVLHEGGPIEPVNDLFDLRSVEVGRLPEQLRLGTSKLVCMLADPLPKPENCCII